MCVCLCVCVQMLGDGTWNGSNGNNAQKWDMFSKNLGWPEKWGVFSFWLGVCANIFPLLPASIASNPDINQMLDHTCDQTLHN